MLLDGDGGMGGWGDKGTRGGRDGGTRGQGEGDGEMGNSGPPLGIRGDGEIGKISPRVSRVPLSPFPQVYLNRKGKMSFWVRES